MGGARRFLTLRHLQREFRLTPDQALALVESGELPAFQVLGEWRVERVELERYVERRYAAARLLPEPEAFPVVPASMPVRAARGANLTGQQRTILHLVGDGMSNAEIATALSVEVCTVKSHVSRLLQRFGMRDREQLIAHAWREGLVGCGQDERR